MAPQQFFQALSDDFGNLLDSQNFFDVRIVIGEAPNIRIFHAHSPILAARSPYFAVVLSSNELKRENNAIIFAKPNISPKIFEIILRYIYNGKISLDKHGVLTILELLATTDELILENFIEPLEDYLIEHHAKNLEENFATLQKTSFMHNSFKKLKNFCTEIAVNNPAIVFNSQDFTSLRVAKLDKNTQVKKVLDWADDNFNTFKESIERLLLLIWFFHIFSVDFYHKVKPFARILPGTLYEDLLHHYLVPGRKDKNTPFEDQLENHFQLLLRNSRDRFAPANFHRLCDYKRATISVIKVKESGQIIGGFNLQSWHFLEQRIDGKRSFIFSFGDDKAENAILSKFVTENGPYGRPEVVMGAIVE
ncbi:hypothetical protein G9A89_002385 [Geosiphon pyriformis]|nr:hypothetical protein G9A89_002385 [Geosiphon pyriformis]